MEIIARELLQHSTEALWSMITDDAHVIRFDDETVIETTGRKILYSSYFWEFHRTYPLTPLLSSHFVDSVLKGKMLDKNTHINLLNKIYWDVAKTYAFYTPAERDPLTEMVYQITNQLYNDLSQHLEAYVVTMDVLDFLQIDRLPKITEVLDSVEPSSESINHVYRTILTEIQTNPVLAHNSVAKAVKSGMVNKNQVLQCIGVRGYVTEVDGWIMPVPVLRGFFRGMRSAYNATTEAHTAGKALFFAEAPLQDGEYFSRRLQLMTMSVEGIERVMSPKLLPPEDSEARQYMDTDCGSKDYLIWRIKGDERHNNEVTRPGDLNFLVGKYYIDPDDGRMKVLRRSDTHLIGKTVKIRTVLGCHLPDRHKTCAVCFGKFGDNVSQFANIGHLTAATMTKQTTQSILSTKHLIASSQSEEIYLDETSAKFFSLNEKEGLFYLKDTWRKRPVEMIITSSEIYGLSDLEIVDNIANINPSRISSIVFAEMRVTENKHIRHYPINLEFHGRKAILTVEFLRYLKLHGWEADASGNFVFTFENWDFEHPIFLIHQKEYSYSRHASEISSVIESKLKDITDRLKPDSPKATLMELFDLVNSKLSVNIACLEIIIYSIMCADINNDKFGLSRNHKTAGLGVRELVIFCRSLSAAYAFERLVAKVINKPSTFFRGDRDDSIFDVFFDPKNVVDTYKRLGKR